MLQVNQLIGFGAGDSGPGGIQFVGGKIEGKDGATSGNTTVAINSGLTGGIDTTAASGDFVIAAFAVGSSADRTLSITDGTTGYTLIASELYSNDDLDTNLRVGYKFITGDTTITFGPTGSADEAGIMAAYVFRGVNATTPLDVAATTATGTSGANADAPSITPTTLGAYIVAVGAAAHVGTTATFNAPSDLVDFFTLSRTENYCDTALGIGHKDDWVSGAFNPAAWVHANPNEPTVCSWAAMSIALRPA
jgi:hypothetical protein